MLEFRTTGRVAVGDEGKKYEVEDLKQFDEHIGEKKFSFIGLQYVKYVVDHLQGKMYMKSNYEGTKFKVALDCGVSNLDLIAPTLPTLNKQIESQIPRLEGSHMLIADEMASSQQKLGELMDSLDLTCEFVSTGLELV